MEANRSIDVTISAEQWSQLAELRLWGPIQPKWLYTGAILCYLLGAVITFAVLVKATSPLIASVLGLAVLIAGMAGVLFASLFRPRYRRELKQLVGEDSRPARLIVDDHSLVLQVDNMSRTIAWDMVENWCMNGETLRVTERGKPDLTIAVIDSSNRKQVEEVMQRMCGRHRPTNG